MVKRVKRDKNVSDISVTLLTYSTPKVIFLIFGINRVNFPMGLKIDFKFDILGILH